MIHTNARVKYNWSLSSRAWITRIASEFANNTVPLCNIGAEKQGDLHLINDFVSEICEN